VDPHQDLAGPWRREFDLLDGQAVSVQANR
jgi:hypothetical protein